MFKFLKDKIKKAVSSFSKKVDEEAEEIKEEVIQEPIKTPNEKLIPPKETSAKKESLEKVSEDSKPHPPVKDQPEKLVEEAIEDAKEKIESVADPIVEETVISPKEKKQIVEKIEKELDSVESVTEEKQVTKKPVVFDTEQHISEVIPEPLKETPDSIINQEKSDVQKTDKQLTKKQSAQDFLAEVENEEPAKIIEKKLPLKGEEKLGKKGGFFSRLTKSITTKKLSQDQFDDIFFELEFALLENNVAVEVIEKIKWDLGKVLVDSQISRNKIEETIISTLQKSIDDVLTFEKVDLLNVKEKPYIISFVGVNGSGKTTTLAKVAHLLKENGKSVVVAACDTFRAAAIQQLEEHTTKLGVKLIKHDYGSDAAAVAFDAVKHATAKNIDYVLIDTAGRLHSNSNLMEELHKINKVVKPHFTMFIGEAITGNDCVEQATKFNERVGIDGIILTKADTDDKGGAFISASYVTKKPIVYIATGQTYADLKEFDKSFVLETLDL